MKLHCLRNLTIALLLVAFLITAVSCGKELPSESDPVVSMTEESSEAEETEPVSQAPKMSLSGALGSTSGTQYMTFLKIDGVEGDCSQSRYAKWIDVTGFSFGSEADTIGGNISPLPFVFSHKLDSAAPKLKECLEKGNWINDAKLVVVFNRFGALNEAITVELQHLKIQKIEYTFDAASGALIETVSVNVGNLSYTVSEIPEIG